VATSLALTKRVLLSIVGLSLGLAGLPGQAWALQPEPVFGVGAAPTWKGQQFVQADRAGRVYFFRSDTFEVYPITKDGRFGEPVRLKTAVTASGTIYNAAMGPAGDRWLIQSARTAGMGSIWPPGTP
jgi:hypothetical protein